MRLLLTYNNQVVPFTTGNYFLDAFARNCEKVGFCLPNQLEQVDPKDWDFYLKIDDGIGGVPFPEHLRPCGWYVIDSHMEHETWRTELAEATGFDCIFTAQKNGVKKFEPYAPTTWVPLACDPSKHRFYGQRKKKYDVAWIGNFHSPYAFKRLEFVEAMFKNYPNFYYGNRTFLEMAEKFKESKIVLNHALNNDINMRYFEACASGSFQLASSIEGNGFEELFEAGKHLETYGDMEAMIEKAGWYLNHEKEREEIARAGSIHVLENHTYDHRVEKMLKILGTKAVHG